MEQVLGGSTNWRSGHLHGSPVLHVSHICTSAKIRVNKAEVVIPEELFKIPPHSPPSLAILFTTRGKRIRYHEKLVVRSQQFITLVRMK